jgi:transposase
VIKNVGDAFERYLAQQQAHLRAAAAAVAREAAPAGATAPPRPPGRREEGSAARQRRRQARYAEVHRLLAAGDSQRAIATRLRLSRRTVTTDVHAEGCPEPSPRGRRRSLVDPWLPYRHERWQAGCRDATALYREIKARGYLGGRSIVCSRLMAWRTRPYRRRADAATEPPGGVRPAAPVRTWSPRQTRWLLRHEEATLTPTRQAYQRHLLEACPALGQAQALTLAFWRLMKERDPTALADWLAAATASGLREVRAVANGIKRDRAAVEAALEHDWSNGQTEGQITKLKLLKRQGYGRAGIALLRARLLKTG